MYVLPPKCAIPVACRCVVLDTGARWWSQLANSRMAHGHVQDRADSCGLRCALPSCPPGERLLTWLGGIISTLLGLYTSDSTRVLSFAFGGCGPGCLSLRLNVVLNRLELESYWALNLNERGPDAVLWPLERPGWYGTEAIDPVHTSDFFQLKRS